MTFEAEAGAQGYEDLNATRLSSERLISPYDLTTLGALKAWLGLPASAGPNDATLVLWRGILVPPIEATRRRDDETASLMRSALQEQQREVQSFAGSIEQASNAQLRGLMSGTESWHTAFTKVLEDLTVKFIEWTEASVAHHLVGEAMMTSATAAGAAARAGTEEAGATASMGAQATAMIRSILSSAAETFAGVFGFLSPLMGPLAAGPAAAAQATVAGMVGAVASADIGMWQVPQDMLTLVHHNELVMPAAEAGAFRSLLGDGHASSGPNGAAVHIHPTTNVHVSALDAGSVSQWMRSNSRAMLKEIDQAVRHGAALGLKRLR